MINDKLMIHTGERKVLEKKKVLSQGLNLNGVIRFPNCVLFFPFLMFRVDISIFPPE